MNLENGALTRATEAAETLHGLASTFAMVGEDPVFLPGVEPLTGFIA